MCGARQVSGWVVTDMSSEGDLGIANLARDPTPLIALGASSVFQFFDRPVGLVYSDIEVGLRARV